MDSTTTTGTWSPNLPNRPHEGFFAHHGFWAPGVRLFRSLQFGIKALLISATFVLPVMGLLVWLITNGAAAQMTERKNAVRQHVEIAHGLVALLPPTEN